jgi:vacuolar iron transporter family protein
MTQQSSQYAHFKGKDALHHIVEVQATGKLASSEFHGMEAAGSFFAAFDAAKDVAITLTVFIVILSFFDFTPDILFALFFSLSGALLFWKFSRATLLAWSRLERLHRVAEEEQREIIEKRPQEREELIALYSAKGFVGKLLEDAVDVMMADGDRLLRVMLQEELGFRLEETEHPLIQGLGAALGALSAQLALFFAFFAFEKIGAICVTVLIVALASAIPTLREKNRVIRSIVWNIGLALFSIAACYYLMNYMTGQ